MGEQILCALRKNNSKAVAISIKICLKYEMGLIDIDSP